MTTVANQKVTKRIKLRYGRFLQLHWQFGKCEGGGNDLLKGLQIYTQEEIDKKDYQPAKCGEKLISEEFGECDGKFWHDS